MISMRVKYIILFSTRDVRVAIFSIFHVKAALLKRVFFLSGNVLKYILKTVLCDIEAFGKKHYGSNLSDPQHLLL